MDYDIGLLAAASPFNGRLGREPMPVPAYPYPARSKVFREGLKDKEILLAGMGVVSHTQSKYLAHQNHHTCAARHFLFFFSYKLI